MAHSQQFRVTKSGSRTTLKDENRERLKDAVKAYEEAEGSLSITQAARLYVASKTTLYHRIHGRQDQLSYAVSKQRLTPEEENSIESWVLEIQSWGFPPRISQLREMAEELLQAKGDYKELGTNWNVRFLDHHPVLQSKYSRTLDQERFLAQNQDSIQEWLDLYQSTKANYKIQSSKVVFSKYQKQAFINQAGKRE